MIASFVFSEPTPSSPGTTVSARAVTNAASYLPPGVAGPLDDYKSVSAIFDIPANTTGGALDLVLQSSGDDGATWFDYARTPTIASAAAAVVYSVPLSLSVGTTTPSSVGKGTATALAANKITGGAWGSRLRLVMTAGTGATSSITVVVRVMGQRKRIREIGG